LTIGERDAVAEGGRWGERRLSWRGPEARTLGVDEGDWADVECRIDRALGAACRITKAVCARFDRMRNMR
jgi:hypothetical protein